MGVKILGGRLQYVEDIQTFVMKKLHLRNEFNFWNVHGIMKTRSIHDSMNIPKVEIITYIYILHYQSSINSQFSSNLAGCPDILN